MEIVGIITYLRLNLFISCCLLRLDQTKNITREREIDDHKVKMQVRQFSIAQKHTKKFLIQKLEASTSLIGKLSTRNKMLIKS